ncbi:MAG: polysaccharide pyruvyl transferase family protein [Phycisphaerales bacterium]|nr:polysaccharide pyruvyl transferase family protein [Phycisphaerales bacterium]
MSNRIAVIGEVFSPNLGDGVIADCMSVLINRAGAVPVHVDLSGKSSWTDTFHPQSVKLAPTLHRTMAAAIPKRIRGALREREWLKNNHQKLADRVAQYAQGCDAAILGGGQLLHDNTLRFPMKIRSATTGLRSSGINRIAVLGCGAGHIWSKRGTQILNEAFEPLNLTWLGLRDPTSLEVMKQVLPEHADKGHWSTDVAIWSDEAYNITPIDLNADRTHVGIGIINPGSALGQVLSDDDPRVQELTLRWEQVASGLRAQGHIVTFFSNGDPHDHAFAQRVAERCRDSNLNPRPARPGELVTQIAQFGSVIAHRLHAQIISYALRVPALPLVWDNKVQGFAEITDRKDLYLPRERQSSQDILQGHKRLLSSGFNDQTRTEHRDRTASHVREAVERLTA